MNEKYSKKAENLNAKLQKKEKKSIKIKELTLRAPQLVGPVCQN